MCGISFSGLSAKYAYNALKTACDIKAMHKLIPKKNAKKNRKKEKKKD